jgi:hypothetical protein
MMSQQGDTLQGLCLTEDNTAVNTVGKIFVNPSAIECIADGQIKIVWGSGAILPIGMSVGKANPIRCRSIEIVSGTFNIGYD